MSHLKEFICSAVLAMAFAAPVQAAEFTARLGSLDPTTTAKHRGLLKAAELVKERTDGNVEIQVFPSAQLGNAREMTEAVQLGALEAVINPASFLGGFNAAVSIFDIPYIFPTSREDSRELREGPFGEGVLESFRERGFEPIALWSGGRKVFTSNKPLSSIDDFAGQRFRVMDSNILIRQFEALDASAIVLNFGELYTSLQNAVIDGQENPIDIIERMKFFEVQKNVLVSEHGAIIEVILFNPAFWQQIPEEYREIIRSAFREVAVEVEEGKEEDAKNSLEFLQQAGLNVQIMSEPDRQKIREIIYPAARDAYLQMAGDKGGELIELYEKELARVTN
jgi:tripartite ATP-independent transporter DctP family solute receptor